MHEKNSQFILLKISPHLVRLLGKIHALSIEVLSSGKGDNIILLLGGITVAVIMLSYIFRIRQTK